MKTTGTGKKDPSRQAFLFAMRYVGLSLICLVIFLLGLTDPQAGALTGFSAIGLFVLLSPWILVFGAPAYVLVAEPNPPLIVTMGVLSIALNTVLIYYARLKEKGGRSKWATKSPHSFWARLEGRLTMRRVVVSMVGGFFCMIAFVFLVAILVSENASMAYFFYGSKINYAYKSAVEPIEADLDKLGLSLEAIQGAVCKDLPPNGGNSDDPTVSCDREGKSKAFNPDEAYRANWRTSAKQLHELLLRHKWEVADYSNRVVVGWEPTYSRYNKTRPVYEQRSLEGVLDKGDRSFTYQQDYGDISCSLVFDPAVDSTEGSFGASLTCYRFFHGLSGM